MLREARPGDAILTIGAGNVSRALEQLAMLLGDTGFDFACGLMTTRLSRGCKNSASKCVRLRR